MGNEIILILGNGFDLQCKLSSGFNQFAKSRSISERCKKFYEKFIPLCQIIGGINDQNVRTQVLSSYHSVLGVVNINLNIWELLFTLEFIDQSDPLNWVDVEGKLQYLLERHGSERSFSSSLFSVFLREVPITKTEKPKEVLMRDIVLKIFEKKSSDKLYCLSKELLEESITKGEKYIFHRFLLNELKRFEECFKSYLRDEVRTKNDLYLQNSSRLLENIIPNISQSRLYFLTFNYTLPKFKQMVGNGTNVHGYIGELDKESSDEIIIGIDHSTSDTDNKEVYMFTKSSRKLYYKPTLQNQPLPQKGEVDKIVIYGHSLGKADYSYFQSIFDYYDLYGGAVKIEFAYTKYDDKVEISYPEKVLGLISEYGKTMKSEPDKGRNLIPKLLLEHRLTIRVVEAIA